MKLQTLLSTNGRRMFRFVLDEKLAGKSTPRRPLQDYTRATIEWLLRAQQATPDDGVAESYHAVRRMWAASYPETTGYIICSLLRAGALNYYDPAVVRSASRKMGVWLTTTQLSDGAFPGGNVAIKDPKPAVFNTGQILMGLSDLIREGLDPDGRLANSAHDAADWMIRHQDEDGAWRRGISVLTTEPVHAYNVRAAWGLARYGVVMRDQSAIDAAVRNGEWLLEVQGEDGWFPHMNFDIGRSPLTHTVAYTIRGLMEIGLLADRSDFVAAATEAAERMRALQHPQTGAVPGQIARPYRSDSDWTSTTGNSQMAIIWYRLARRTGEAFWRDAADRAVRFNSFLQELDWNSRDDGRRGGVRGSYPGHKGYGRYWYMNWTHKFHLDALMDALEARHGKHEPVRAETSKLVS